MPPYSASAFRSSSRRLLAGVALAAASLGAGQALALDLTVEVLNVGAERGQLSAALYTSDAGWLKPDQLSAGLREPARDKAVLVFRNLVPGRYAVVMFHDENGNTRLDLNPAGLPIERLGFSRDAVGVMGPPAFNDAVIDLQADTAITVRLR